MNTTINTHSRRMDISGYNAIINSRNERDAQEKAAQEALRQKEFEDMSAASQNNINALCKDIQGSYTLMVKNGKDMQRYQNELVEKQKEQELFNATADEIYPHTDVDESTARKMSFRRFAYYALPALDCFFAYFALYPIITSKIADLSSALSGFAVVIGAVLSIVVVLGLSLISRMGVASLDDNDSNDKLKTLKKFAIGGAAISLPLMYIIGEIAFNGGEQWTYSGCFAFISLIIQLLIVSGYKRQVEALAYCREIAKNESVKHIKEADENALRQEIATIRERIQGVFDSFEKEYANFTDKFRSLAVARDGHIDKFGKDAKYYLNQMVIYIGDLICFRREAIPLYYEANGTVSTIPFVDFPHISGGLDIYYNTDFVYLDYMMRRSQTGISLSETLRLVEEQRQPRLNHPEIEPKAHEHPKADVDTPSSENDTDDDQGDGGIW